MKHILALRFHPSVRTTTALTMRSWIRRIPFNALLHEAEKLQRNIWTRSRSQGLVMVAMTASFTWLRAECAELISDGFGDEVDPFTLLDGEISADTVQEFMEAVEAYKLEFLDIRDDDTRTLSKTKNWLRHGRECLCILWSCDIGLWSLQSRILTRFACCLARST